MRFFLYLFKKQYVILIYLLELLRTQVTGDGKSHQELLMSVDTAFTAGAVVSAVLVATLRWVAPVRYVALLAGTMAITVVFIRGGVPELIDYAGALETLLGGAPAFSAGIICGGLAVALMGFKSHRKRATE